MTVVQSGTRLHNKLNYYSVALHRSYVLVARIYKYMKACDMHTGDVDTHTN